MGRPWQHDLQANPAIFSDQLLAIRLATEANLVQGTYLKRKAFGLPLFLCALYAMGRPWQHDLQANPVIFSDQLLGIRLATETNLVQGT
jgi:hypothetical protein